MRKGNLVRGDVVETEPIIKSNGTMLPGLVEFYICCNPDGTNEKVGLYNKGVQVLPSITRLREFNKFPWNSGKLTGTIDDNFCELPNRTDPPWT